MHVFRFRLALTLFVLPSLLILIGLGMWQLQRAEWKNALIAQIEAGLDKATQPLDLRGPLPDPFDPVFLKGQLEPSKSINLLGHTIMGVTGEHLVSLVILKDGRGVAVNRGWVPQNWRDGDQSAKQVELIVQMREPQRLPNMSADAVNSVEKNIWIMAVPEQLGQIWGVETMLPRIAHVLKQDSEAYRLSSDEPPLGHLPKTNLPNNHLGYALTWFALAISLAVIYAMLSLRPAVKPED